jgi:5-methyltetrahydrofolate--homocysteine methyltransferase
MTDLHAIAAAIEAGDRARARNLTSDAVDAGMSPRVILDAMTEAMRSVGTRFQQGELFVPEMLIAARAMSEATAVLEPLLASAGARPKMTAVIGTVQGDLHDIGKNLVGMMWRGAGIEVIDLGTNVSPEGFVDAANSHGADVVGISALLTTTMVGIGGAVAAVRASGPQGAKIVIGGAPVTPEFAVQVGADGYAPDAASAVDVVQSLMQGAPAA